MFEGQYMTQREYDTQGLDESYSNSRKKAGKNKIKELLNRLKSKDDKNQNRIFEMQNNRSLKGKHSPLILFRK
jgi:predicted transcriptional regulator YdeE